MRYVPFSKSQELLRLADMAAAREQGASLDEIRQTFGVSLRSAQRMTQALTRAFPSVVVSGGRKGEPKRWSLSGDERLLHLKGIRDDELAALEMSIPRWDGCRPPQTASQCAKVVVFKATQAERTARWRI
jgi:predicted DNA-binding transcriptional regulator YafY